MTNYINLFPAGLIILSFVIAFASTVAAQALAADAPYVSCQDDANKYHRRSDELQRIEAEDQADRPNNVLKPGAQIRDRQRRERVGSIFGEGCLKEARDFAAAALVFQHGDQPDHFMQTFLWAKRAVELGDSSQQLLMAWGIDRYLVNIKHKQLFGSQYLKNDSNNPGSCWCLDQTDTSFPDQLRLKYTGHNYQHQLDSLKVLNVGLSCPVAECAEPLAPSPAGTIPGFW
jgi:hypothetical protein